METAWLIYWYLVIGNLVWVVCVIDIVAIIGLLFLIGAGVESNFGEKRYSDSTYGFERELGDELMPASIFYNAILPYVKRFALAGVIVSGLASLYPDKEDLAYIFGGAALVSVAQTEEAQKLPDNVLRAVNVFLEGVAEEEE